MTLPREIQKIAIRTRSAVLLSFSALDARPPKPEAALMSRQVPFREPLRLAMTKAR
jgi:hypothetical protein